jgi:hypothetical protein
MDAAMTDPTAPDSPDRQESPKDPEALERQKLLGMRLRIMFDSVVDEGIPDEFDVLLSRFDSSEPNDG